ncbi:6-phosphofructokinase [Escherichia coli]|nr:6-phosphofructokinase [Escherichia coli]
MVRIYTLTLAPSLDSATITPQIYPEGKLRCTAPVFEPGGGGINVARAIAHLGGSATAIFPAGGATGEHLVSLLADEKCPRRYCRSQRLDPAEFTRTCGSKR